MAAVQMKLERVFKRVFIDAKTERQVSDAEVEHHLDTLCAEGWRVVAFNDSDWYYMFLLEREKAH